MFALVILVGLDPLAAIPLAGIASALLAIPTAFFLFRCKAPISPSASWVIAEVVRLALAQWKMLGGGTGTSLRARLLATRRRSNWSRAVRRQISGAGDILTYWLALLLAITTIASSTACCARNRGLGLAAVRDNQEAARSVGVDARAHEDAGLSGGRLRHRVSAGALIYVQKARISPDAAFSVVD